MSLDPTVQLTYDLQRQDQATIALTRVLRMAHLLAATPRDDVSLPLAAGLDALAAALATYTFWTHP